MPSPITTTEDLLSQFLEVGLDEIDRTPDLGHTGMTGDMYEGLTKDLVEKALFAQFDLRVAGGKIRNSAGDLSQEIDCMLVVGDGERLPFTSDYLYDIQQVVAVVEVKKTLNLDELKDAHVKFRTLAKVLISDPKLNPLAAHKGAMYRIHTDAFRAVCRKPFPLSATPAGLDSLSRAIYHTLALDALLPLRIVWAYGGYKTEKRLRKAFVDLLQQGPTGQSYSPGWPNLVACADLSLVKANGMPFASERVAGSTWDIFYSQRKLTIRNLLNILWYRLTKMYVKEFAWLTDGKVYKQNLLASVRYDSHGKMACDWHRAKSDAEFALREEVETVPLPISLEELAALNWLGEIQNSTGLEFTREDFESEFRHRVLDLESAAAAMTSQGLMQAPMRIQWESVDDLVQQLTRTGMIVVEGHLIRLTTSRCMAWFTREGPVAGENRDGSLSKYLGPLKEQLFNSESDPMPFRGVVIDVLTSPPHVSPTQPCPCGSGAVFKDCHGKTEEPT